MWIVARFADAIRKHWGSIVTSVAMIGALSVRQSIGHTVKPAVYCTIALVCFVFAARRAWNDQLRTIESRDNEARKKEAEPQVQLDKLKRCSLEVEFLKATRSGYMYGSGTSPVVSVFITALVRNRNRESTAVYAVRRIGAAEERR